MGILDIPSYVGTAGINRVILQDSFKCLRRAITPISSAKSLVHTNIFKTCLQQRPIPSTTCKLPPPTAAVLPTLVRAILKVEGSAIPLIACWKTQQSRTKMSGLRALSILFSTNRPLKTGQSCPVLPVFNDQSNDQSRPHPSKPETDRLGYYG